MIPFKKFGIALIAGMGSVILVYGHFLQGKFSGVPLDTVMAMGMFDCIPFFCGIILQSKFNEGWE